MRTSTPLHLCLVLLLSALTLPVFATSDPADFFRDGVASSRAGNHEAALRQFEAAREAGLDTPQLHYNLGISYRRTGDNASAKRAFRRATHSPELAGPAHYQLGRIALYAGDAREAQRQFHAAERSAQTELLRDASRRQLAALVVSASREPRRGHAFLALEGGYDGNVAKTDETARESTEGAVYGDLLGWGEYRLMPQGVADLRVSGTFNTRRHAGEPDANLVFIQAGPAWHQRTGNWQTHLGVQVSEFQLQGDRVEHTVELVAGAEQAFPRLGDVRTRLRMGRASGGNGFDHLDGYRHDLQLALHRHQDSLPWFVRYDFVYENRDDLETADGGFQSASPMRQGLTAGIRPILADGMQLELTAGYRLSRYSDPDRLAGGESIRRKDERIRLEAGMVRQLHGAWDTAARVSWTDSSSNRAEFNYDRFQASLGVERGF